MITTLNPCWIRITARKFKVIIRWLSIADLASIRFSSDANCLILVSQVGIISLIEGPDCAGSGAKEILETSLRGLKYDKLVSIPSYLAVLQSVWKLAKKVALQSYSKMKKMLQTLCIFKQKTVNRLFSLKNSADPATLLLEFINANEPLWNELPRIHANSVFRQHFKDRIQQVWNWIQTCQLRVNYKPLK